MKLVLKNADFSANGIQMQDSGGDTPTPTPTPSTIVVDNATVTENLYRLNLQDLAYKITITPANTGNFIVKSDYANSKCILPATKLTSGQTYIFYIEASSALETVLQTVDITSYNLTIEKVNEIDFNTITAPYTTANSHINLDPLKTYTISLKMLYDSETAFKIYNQDVSPQTVLKSYDAINNATYQDTITGVSQIGFRTSLIDAQFRYKIDEVESNS